jgi:hypothetical protein
MEKYEFEHVWKQIIIKTWDDPVFKERLITAPKETLLEYGIEVSKGITIVTEEESLGAQNTCCLILPRNPLVGENLK